MESNNFFQSNGTKSFYEDLRAQDAYHGHDAGLDRLHIDEENLRANLDEIDIEQAEALMGGESRATLESHRAHFEPDDQHIPQRIWPNHDDDAENDVPPSLLVEANGVQPESRTTPQRHRANPTKSIHLPDSSTKRARTTWDTSKSTQLPRRIAIPKPSTARLPTAQLISGSPREQALWQWVNTSNLDIFIKDVYDYFEGCGMWCIICDRALRLLETSFIVILLTFLTQCIDYHLVPTSRTLHQIVVPKCTTKMSTPWNVGIWMFVFYFIWKCVQFTVDIRRLHRIRNFYVHLLNIPEQDMQTVSWQDIVARIMALRDANPNTATNLPQRLRKYIGSQSKERLDAHDIANRLMRQDNFLIAMINKDVFDLSLPLPFFRGKQFFSKTLEWCLQFSILDFVFNEAGQVRQEFLKADRRGVLSHKLRQRFIFAGLLNLVFAPFVMGYILIVYIFTYYQEYQKDPSTLGARRYTTLAEWKFREFNELPHMFRERINMSYPFATRYMTQFPKQMTEQVAKTVAFITGALAAVLAAASVLDPELFINFEITQARTVLFYFTVLGAIWAFARGSISDETAVFNPEYALRNVIDYIHYEPRNWQGRLHSTEVKNEFSELYKLKWAVVLEELLGIITAPCILLLSLPKSSDQIIDFFREFTIHVDGMGYVCSFAVFDFKKPIGAVTDQSPADVRDDYYSTKHGKMAASFYGFIDNYVINPKTGIPGYVPPGRHQFHLPPSFSGLNSPTLGADLQASRTAGGHNNRAPEKDHRARYRSASAHVGSSRALRHGPAIPHPSPMASVLLDPHHQISTATYGNISVHRMRQARGGLNGEESIIDEEARNYDLEDGGEFRGTLDESTWETSPAKALSRENSGTNTEEAETGVLGLIYQLQQTQRPQRNARVL